MKRREPMKRITTSLLTIIVLSVIVISGCLNDEAKTVTGDIEKQLGFVRFLAETNNPYEKYGIDHNKGMDYILDEIKRVNSSGKNVNEGGWRFNKNESQ
jgi:hypothetical protein